MVIFRRARFDDISLENAHQIFGFFLVRYIQAAELKPGLRNACDQIWPWKTAQW